MKKVKDELVFQFHPLECSLSSWRLAASWEISHMELHTLLLHQLSYVVPFILFAYLRLHWICICFLDQLAQLLNLLIAP